MHTYCANFYAAVNCQNKVTRFGQRCKLCTVMNEGMPAKENPFAITDNDYAYDSEVIIDDEDSSQEDSSRERSRESSESSSK
ncbi:hypothetical protein M426DRAFT_14106 [Hypoxylon sp. CI-4A]|nr:hypothetical protein M426DRAFT_14106 [Hypoxylon sp. CI-4A]